MIPDIKPLVGVWTDVYSLTGLSAGTRLSLQNKSGGKALVWEGAAPPAVIDGDDRHGYQIFMDRDPVKTSVGIPGCWVLYWETGYTTNGRLCVQAYTS